MDESGRRAHDPFAPHFEEDFMADAAFREDRWRRVGATDDEVEVLRNEHEVRPLNDQFAESSNVDSVSDDDLRAELDARRAAGALVDQSIPIILDQVGDDAGAAMRVLDAERRRPRPRATLIDKLEKVALSAAGGQQDSPQDAGAARPSPFPQRNAGDGGATGAEAAAAT